jgi:hypothetical protein
MSEKNRRDEDKRRGSSLGDLAREVFGVPRPRGSQGSDKDVGGSEEGTRYPCRRRPITMRDFIKWFFLALVISVPPWVGGLLAMHVPATFILLSTPLIIALDAGIVSLHYIDAKEGPII